MPDRPDPFETVPDAQERQTLVCVSCKTPYSVVGYYPSKNFFCKRCGGRLMPPDDAASKAMTVPALPQEVLAAQGNPKNLVGKYVLVSELGRGGMGVVWKAWDGGLKRWVALKLLTLQAEGEDLARFQREAETAGSLKHPSIVGIYEVGCHDERHFIAMEYVNGRTLSGQRLPIQKAVEVMVQVTEAVDYAHSKGIIHRDLKPSNIMIDETDRPCVMDFGLAKSVKTDTRLTLSGMVVGTPAYMSPEQAKGQGSRVDRRTDVYALGAVLYEVVTGHPVFRGEDALGTLLKVVKDDPIPPSSFVEVPKDVEIIILKCLEKDKTRRYPTARQLAEDLKRWLAGTAIAARAVSVVERAKRQLTKHRVWVVASASGLLVGALVVLAIVGGRGRPSGGEAERGDRQSVKDSEAAPGREADREATEKRSGTPAEVKKTTGPEGESVHASGRVKAEPDYDAGRDRLDEAQRNLYRPGADLAGMRAGFENAVTRFSRAIEACPDFHEAYLGRGQAYILLARPDEAEADFAKAIALLPTYVSAYVARGKLYLARYMALAGSIEGSKADLDRADLRVWREKAVADFRKAQDLGGLGAAGEFVRASLLFGEKDFAGAIRVLTGLIEAGSKSEECFKLRGDAAWELARRAGVAEAEYTERALADYGQALTVCPNYTEARRCRGILLYGTGKREEAFADFKANLELSPNDSFVLSDMGTWCQRQGQTDAALEYYAKATRLNPRNEWAWTNRAAIKLKAKDYRGALEDCEAALKANPLNVTARFNHASAQFDLRREAEALAELSALIEENPAFAPAYFSRGQIHRIRGRWTEAIGDLERAVRLDGRLAEKAQPLLEECRRRMGEK